MPRRTIKRWLPDTETVKNHSALQWISGGFANPQIWHLNRRSVSGAVAIGLFIGWLPIPMQMLIAAFLAMVTHVNLPISVLLVWISNPLTLPALLYAAYWTGANLFGFPVDLEGFKPTLQWLMHSINDTWKPIVAGSVFLGAVTAVTGFLLTRLVWRVSMTRKWQERRAKRALLPRPRSGA